MNYSDALESKLATARVLKHDLSLPLQIDDAEMAGFQASHNEQARRTVRWMAANDILPRCDAFYWDAALADAVLSSSTSLPSDTTIAFRELPREGWMWFQKPLREGVVSENAICGLLWLSIPQADQLSPSVMMMAFSSAEEGGFGPLAALDVTFAGVREGASIGELDAETRTPTIKALIKFWTAAALWLEQRIIVAPVERPNRACRRRMERENAHTEGLRVVRLRKAEARDHSDASSGPATWSCQWIVRGHWRQQYYPSTGERSPLWIMPYVKGPEDAPLKTPGATVFAVTR